MKVISNLGFFDFRQCPVDAPTKGGSYFTASVRLYAHLLDESRACGSRENSDSDIDIDINQYG